MSNFLSREIHGHAFVKLWLYASVIWLTRVIMWNYIILSRANLLVKYQKWPFIMFLGL